ncbi:hypothetical protein A3D71_02130 [Candidatus Kaiserbacteria bacterium RIFCSPHIGHO2_02_FULL_55_20]|uniref:Uncharacterized protein n=1 Tax=Candidatus Kaiserbacteria bacterium RIFCSPHIGHO2_02_FULL_55_20 TaxID=1798497 RepID=A0A1F6DX32_9BACT|nr:MAG: hypothetical protein A2680_02990 [Candidatus Kaiserbacteria bacterium RIFCSPHIGHO2_01_FULL_55_37]OGG65994.1 MAG: hypothetical protein A3D71_02130 [Candidatus Kaiserbacteria bacterium RIFCSPHIGHO2_02_FULL_55_20]
MSERFGTEHSNKLVRKDIPEVENGARGPISKTLLATLAALSISQNVAMSQAEAQTPPAGIESGTLWKDGVKQMQDIAKQGKGHLETTVIVQKNGTAIFLAPAKNQSEARVFSDAKKEAAAVCDIRIHTQEWGSSGSKAGGLPMELPPTLIETETPLMKQLLPISIFDYDMKPEEEKKPIGQLQIKGIFSPNGVMHYHKGISISDDVVNSTGSLMRVIDGDWWRPSAYTAIQEVLDNAKGSEAPFQLFVSRGWHKHVTERMNSMNDTQINALVEKLSPDARKGLEILTKGKNPEAVSRIRRDGVLEALQVNEGGVAGLFFAGDDVGKQKQEAWVKFVRKPARELVLSFFDDYKKYTESSAKMNPNKESQERLKGVYARMGVDLQRDVAPEVLPCGVDPKTLRQQQ